MFVRAFPESLCLLLEHLRWGQYIAQDTGSAKDEEEERVGSVGGNCVSSRCAFEEFICCEKCHSYTTSKVQYD